MESLLIVNFPYGIIFYSELTETETTKRSQQSQGKFPTASGLLL
jgi:hypothetical protein